MIKTAGRIFFLDVAEVGWIEAADNYVHLHVGRDAHLHRDSLNGLAAKLDPAQFLRIRHSAIVNLKQIKELRPLFRGEYSIILFAVVQSFDAPFTRSPTKAVAIEVVTSTRVWVFAPDDAWQFTYWLGALSETLTKEQQRMAASSSIEETKS